jgi:aldose 1-epimerase
MRLPLTKTIITSTLSVLCAINLAMASPQSTSVKKSIFGTDGNTQVDLYELTNSHGMTVKIMTRGATITEIKTPDKAGKLSNVTLGFDTFKDYLNPQNPYFGAIVGRVGNRIAKGKFTVNGNTYSLATNNGLNHLHGGIKGFDKVIWNADVIPSSEGASVKFSYLSKDGEEGYPGNCNVTVTYTLTTTNSLVISYDVNVDKDCPVNVTNHTYFNLSGAEHGSILNHAIQINADNFTPVDDTLIPTGEIKSVKSTPMDFTSSHNIGDNLKAVGGNPVGYDHNYVLNKQTSFSLAATVHDPVSGRTMEVYTTEPGVQFYTGNFLDGTLTGKNGVVYKQYAAFCLETQHFPDTVNQPNFPTNVLKAGQNYHSKTVFKFSAK